MHIVEFFNGLIYSDAAFSYIVTIYIIKVFSNSFSLGIFTSIFSIITFIIGILFAEFIKKEYYSKIIKISTAFTICFLVLMIFHCNSVTIVLFNLFQTISKKLKNLIIGNIQYNLSNYGKMQKEYKTEYWLANETSLVIGRILSSIAFILIAYTDSMMMIIIFVFVLTLFTINAIKLQKMVEEEK